MSVKLTHWFQLASLEHPYTNRQQVKILSLGTFYDNLRVPDLLLTVLYRFDERTGSLVKNARVILQPDGPSDAQLNFPSVALTGKYTHRVYKFEVKMDAVFGGGIVYKESAKVGGNIGAEKVVKGGVDTSIELAKETPSTRTYIHAHIEGMLSANEGKLEAWGRIL